MIAAPSEIKIIQVDDAVQIHHVLAEYFNKYESEPDPILPVGTRDKGLLESALNRLNTSIQGNDGGTVEKYNSLDQKAAALLYGLIKNHPFYNGNKRTALAICFVFYDLNGATIEAEEDDLFNFIVKIAAGKLDDSSDTETQRYSFDQDIVKWLKAHKKTYFNAYGDISAKKFINQCRQWGCNTKSTKGSHKVSVISTGKSISFQQSSSKIEAAVAKRYISELGLGLTLNDFLLNTIGTNNKFIKILPVLRKLAFA